jgi:flagellin-specific chaperone FliS
MTQTEMVRKQRRKLQELIKETQAGDHDENLNRIRVVFNGYSTLLGYLNLEKGLDIDQRLEALEQLLKKDGEYEARKET